MFTLYFDKFDDMKRWLTKHYMGDEAFINNRDNLLTISFFLSSNVFVLRCLEPYNMHMLEQLSFQNTYWGELEEGRYPA